MMHNNTQHQFISHDGTSLFYQRWAASDNPEQKAIVLFHRGHEHSQRMAKSGSFNSSTRF